MKNSEVYYTLPGAVERPPEELPAAAAQCSAVTLVIPTGHKAVSSITVHLEYSHLTKGPLTP